MGYTYDELVSLAISQLYKGGAFLMAGKQEKNPMTIGWCQFGRLWNEPICAVFVRHSRYSHALIERDGVFTVNFPMDGSWQKALGFCGTKSGRDVNKLEALGLHTVPNAAGGVDSIGGNIIRFECKITGKAEFQAGLTYLRQDIRERFYNPEKEAGSDGDLHTVYYAENLHAEWRKE
ncbi:MAG: flavin reductase [Clostridiales bacterium]|jgi:flavin reductase (DIM6/NTAB) family NADH-FMN oxidoreductase RutF|nr:flavin reductase [Clostridiales bacterium]